MGFVSGTYKTWMKRCVEIDFDVSQLKVVETDETGKESIENCHRQVMSTWKFMLVPLMFKVFYNKAFFKTVNKSNHACLVTVVLCVRLGHDGSLLSQSGDNSSSETGVSFGKGSRSGLGTCVLGSGSCWVLVRSSRVCPSVCA